MHRQIALAVLALLLAGCHLAARAPAALPPLGDEAEVAVYLEPMPRESAGLAFTLSSVALQREDGPPVPLRLVLAEVTPAAATRQRLLARGRVPAGAYSGLAVAVKQASIVGGDGKPAALHVPPEPVDIVHRLRLERGRAAVISLKPRPEKAVTPSFGFDPALDAAAPFRPTTDLLGFAACPATASVAVFDRRAHAVVELWPAGAEPRSLALDPLRALLFVALAGEDAVQVFDVASGAERGRVALRPGDRPVRLALAPDGRRLLVVNEGSDTLAFVDVEGLEEVDRVAVGQEPGYLTLARGGRTAFVLSARQATVTAVDVPNRAVTRTYAVDAAPSLARLSPDEKVLYLAHAGSPFLSALDLASGTSRRLFVGAPVEALLVEPRRGLLLAGLRGEARLSLYEPASLMPVGSLELPGRAGDLVIDDVENAVVAALPGPGAVAFSDLTSRKATGLVELGDAPAQLALPDERR